MRLISELKRRNVFRMAVVYVVAAWLIMQVAGVLMDLGALPEWSGPWVLTVLAIGFPIALIISWFYEITPEGLALEKDVPEAASITHATGRRMDFVVIAMLCAAVILFAYDKWWPAGPIERSIAVLAFDNLSGDPGNEYFSDGISGEILNLLAQIKPLKVIARQSSFSFKGKNIDIATIAEQLNVGWVLEGNVRRHGDRVRVTAQLIDASDSTQVWSQTFDRDLSAADVFHVQSEIARAVTRELRTALTEEDEERLAKVPTENMDAYAAYLLGRQRLTDRKVKELGEAAEQFALAIELDPNFANAYSGLADACYLYQMFSGGFVHEYCPSHTQGREYMLDMEPVIRKALALDDTVGEAWVSLGNLKSYEAYATDNAGKSRVIAQESLAAFEQAIALNPSFSQAYHWYALALAGMPPYGDPELWLEAWESHRWQSVIERGLEVDPLSVMLHYLLADYPMWARTKDEAFFHARRIVEIAPDSPKGYERLGELSWHLSGRIDESIRWLSRAFELDPGHSGFLNTIAYGYATLGDLDMALAYVKRSRRLLAPEATYARDHLINIEAYALLLLEDDMPSRVRRKLDQAEDLSSHHRLRLLAAFDVAVGRTDEALARYKEHRPQCFGDWRAHDGPDQCDFSKEFALLRVLQLAGHEEHARAIAEETFEGLDAWRMPPIWNAFHRSALLAILGRHEEALDLLEILVAEHWRGSWLTFFNLSYILYYDISFDPIREHPRFQALVTEIEADLAQQLENVREMERNGELPTHAELRAELNSD